MMQSRYLLTMVLSTCLVIPTLAHAKTLDVKTRIDHVTVFLDRATVTRIGETTLTPGTHTIHFSDVSSILDPDSVTVRGAGTAQVTIVGTRVVTEELEEVQNPKIVELQQALRVLDTRSTELQQSLQILGQEREYLDSIRAVSADQVGRDLVTTQPNMQSVSEVFAFLGTSYRDNAAQVQSTKTALEDLQRTRDKLRRELRQLGRSRKSTTTIAVDVEVATGGTLALSVDYRIGGATWTPTYEARATHDQEAVLVSSSATVRQRTGEDWSNVTLTLSTARPSLGGRMPELSPWYLSQWRPVHYETKRANKMARREASLGMASPEGDKQAMIGNGVGGFDGVAFESEPPMSQPSAIAEATIDSAGPAVEFQVARRETIRGDWQPRKLPLGQQELPATMAYRATPKLAPHAYLHAEVTNASDAFMLPGEVQVFLDGAFIAKSSIDGIASGETFDLYLGVDERINIERKQLSAKVDVSVLPGLHGKSRTVDYAYLTTIKNHTGRAITLHLFDQVPVSNHDEIKIEQVQWSVDPLPIDQEKPGVREWVLALAPQAAQTLRVAYRVRHPVSFRVQGMVVGQ